MKTNKSLCTILTYGGTIPYIAVALLLYFNVSSINLIGSLPAAIVSYSLMIVSFLCGTQWALYLKHDGEVSINLYLTSSVIVVALWLLDLLTPTDILLICFVIAFSFLLIIDMVLSAKKIIRFRYLLLRVIATAIVIASLVFIFLFLYGHPANPNG